MANMTKGELFTNTVLEIFKLNGLLISEGDQLTRELGLSSARWKVLGALALSDSPLTVPQIAREMGQTRQGVQRLTDIMERDGLLHYQENPQHKRARLVSLTSQGKAAYKRLEKKQSPWAIACSKDLSLDELKVTASVLRQIIRGFEA